MRLKTRLVLATTIFTVLLTAALGSVFFAELLRGRIAQVDASNDVLAHELLLSMRDALENGVAHQPDIANETEFERFVANTLQQDDALQQTMDAIVSYSPTVQDVSVSAANGRVLMATDPALLALRPSTRRPFTALVGGGLRQQLGIVFGRPEVLDVALPLRRNGGAFLFAHIGIRSTLLKAALLPWLRDAALVILAALLCSLVAAVLLSSVALRPIERISRQLEVLSRRERAKDATASEELGEANVPGKAPYGSDPEAYVASTIAEIDRRMRVTEQQATNLTEMLRTLKDGMLLLEADATVAVQSDSVRHFWSVPVLAGTSVFTLFAGTAAESLLREAFATRTPLRTLVVALQDDRDVELSLTFVGNAASPRGAMLTLHDIAARAEIEQEIEISRRMASIGRLTAGVGHEVKNPIHAMVLHLELLRSKLEGKDGNGAVRHVDVLASEMTRLDRVVQALADFSKPMDPVLRELPLRAVLDSVVQLVSVDAAAREIAIRIEDVAGDATATVDREMLHQAVLNMVLNAMDAIGERGQVTISLVRERGAVTIEVKDSGAGIPPDVLPRIFNLYFTTKVGGSGIGLAMTWRMVQMMGGTIAVQSIAEADAPDRGTRMTIRFPLASRSAALPRTSTVGVAA